MDTCNKACILTSVVAAFLAAGPTASQAMPTDVPGARGAVVSEAALDVIKSKANDISDVSAKAKKRVVKKPFVRGGPPTFVEHRVPR